MIAHIIFFQPKAGISLDQRRQFVEVLQVACQEIAEVRRAVVGKMAYFGVMPEISNGQKTYKYAAVIEFSDQDSLQRYLDHPAHAEVRRLFWEFCASTMIADVEMMEPSAVTADWLVE